ncbi:hypothetical protein BY458DRAFT_522288 [Sporodiniella umbellata]|nr:hypothetical protein BY458DRAFT_522288 [Sporodiniella umbellata]
MHYINFELTFYDQQSNKRILNVFENAKKSLINLLNRTPSNSFTQFLPEADTQSFLKRPLEAEDNSFVKQPRYDAYYGQQVQPQVPNISLTCILLLHRKESYITFLIQSFFFSLLEISLILMGV